MATPQPPPSFLKRMWSSITGIPGAIKGAISNAVTRPVAQKIEASTLFNRFIRKWDTYADAESGPEGKPKTVCGGFVTLVMACVVIVVVAFNIYTLAQKKTTLATGDPIHISYKDNSFKVRGLVPVPDGQAMHYPVMNLDIQNSLFLFEADAPGIQKITVKDNTQFNPDWATATQDPPTTKSIYAQIKVPFDSIEDYTGFLQGRFGAVTLNSNDLYQEQLPSQFSQSVQTLQLLAADAALQNSSFFAHTAHTYLRFDKQQLTQLLDNQLDIVMYNLAQYSSLTGTHDAKVAQLSSLKTDPAPWKITSRNSSFNVLRLSSSMSSAISGSSENPLNWQLKMQYGANFNYSLSDFYCYSTGSLTEVPFAPIGWATAPTASGTTITMEANANLIASFSSLGLSTPFQMIIWDRIEAEKVTVTAVSGNTLTIVRTDGWDFAQTVNDENCQYYEDMPFLARMPLPANWICPPEYYNDMYCDCGCGDIDIDCAFCKQSPNDDGNYCDYKDQFTATPVQPMVAIGVACPADGSKWPGDAFTRGFFANPSLAQAPQCPEDSYYGGTAIYFPNGTIWCNAKPSAQIVEDPDKGTYVFQPLTPLIYDQPFPASLTIGKYSFNVTATIADDAYWTVTLTGRPAGTACGTKPNVPNNPYGYLRTSIKFGEMILLYTPYNNNAAASYLPPDGPYSIQINGRQLTVSSASCPRTDDNAQVVVLASPPESRLLDTLSFSTTTAEVTAVTLKGANVIPVQAASDRLLSDHFCCYNALTVSVGDSNIDAYLYGVTSITQNSAAGPDCCSVTCTASDVLYLHLDRGLHSIAQQGSSVSTLQYLPLDLTTCNPANLASSLTEVFLVSVLEAKPTSKGNAFVYQTDSRYKNFPVTDLDVEASIYIVPTKKDFDQYYNLCSGQQNFTASTDPKAYSVKTDKYSTVHDCKYTQPIVADSDICEVLDCGAPKLPPTKKFEFTQTMPINEKWNVPKEEIDQVNGPEYDIDVSSVYYFDYSAQDLYTGKQFNLKTPQEGDYDQNNVRMKFSGELDFIGKVNSTDPNISLYPANAPILDFSVVISADKAGTAAILKKIGNYQGVSKVQGWNKNTVDKFGDITLSWPDILPLTLQPGYNYTFTAKVTVQPVFNLNLVQSTYLDSWVNSTTLTYTMVPSEFVNRNKANVRLLVSFDSSTTTLDNKLDYTLLDFWLGLGAALGLLGAGMGFLSCWQDWSLPEEESEEKPNPYHSSTPTSKKTLEVSEADPSLNV